VTDSIHVSSRMTLIPLSYELNQHHRKSKPLAKNILYLSLQVYFSIKAKGAESKERHNLPYQNMSLQ